MADTSIGTPEQLRDPNYTPALHRAIPLGIQHVLAMFVSNVTPAIIVCGAAALSLDLDDRVITHLSPARYEHINPYGTYNFDVQAILERPEPRPLRPASLR